MAQLGVYNSARVNVGHVFPDGTVLNAYLARDFPVGHNGSPMGQVQATTTVEDGIAFFQNRPAPGEVLYDLVDGERYLAAGQVNGTWRYVGFSLDPQKQQGAREDNTPAADTMIRGHNFEVGYNPAVDNFPTDTQRWGPLTFVIVTDKGGGNRFFAPAGMLTGIDPPELGFRGMGPNNTAPYGPNDDGTDLEAAPIGRGAGRLLWQLMNPQGRFAGWLAHIGVHGSDVAREDNLNTTLASEITLPQSTIEVNGDLDSIASHADGTLLPWYQTGEAQVSGNTIFYRARDTNTLYGCTGGSGTIAAGTTIRQHQISNPGTMHFHTSSLGTNDRANRMRINPDGSIIFGEQAIIESSRDANWLFQGGSLRVKAARAPSNFTATVVGTSGTASITYNLVGNTTDGKQTAPVSVTIATAPDTLSASNYVKLDWDHSGAGIESWDVIRSSTTGLPADTGPIQYRRPANVEQKPGAVDYGQTPTGLNEVQTVVVRNATSGTFRLDFGGGTTNPIELDDTAAEFEAKLEAVGAIGSGNVSVEDVGEAAWRITFIGSLAATNVQQFTLRLPHELVNEPELPEDPPEDEDPEPFPAPSVIIRTRVPGGPVAYVLPTRDSTGDATVDGRLTISQMAQLPELSADPAAPATNNVVVYAKNVGGKTALIARFPTGAVQQIAIEP